MIIIKRRNDRIISCVVYFAFSVICFALSAIYNVSSAMCHVRCASRYGVKIESSKLKIESSRLKVGEGMGSRYGLEVQGWRLNIPPYHTVPYHTRQEGINNIKSNIALTALHCTHCTLL